MKKGQMIYASYGSNLDKFFVEFINNEGAILKMIGLGIYISSKDNRTFIETDCFKKWYHFWW